MSSENGRRIAIDFIDPLFATVISLNFAQIMMESWFTPANLSKYFQQPWLVSSELDTSSKLQIAGLLLAYLTIVTSWVGYHVSIKNSPIDVEKSAGFFRFIVDIVLLALYWLLLIDFQSLTFQLYLLILVFLTFVVWDQLKSHEYKAHENINSQRRRGVTLLFLLIFVIIFSLYISNAGFPVKALRLSVGWRDLVFLVGAAVSLIMYRVHKVKLFGGRLLDVFSLHRPGFYQRPLRIYVAGPYSADGPAQTEKNVEKAIDAGLEVYRKGHFPFIPHLTHFVELRAQATRKNMKYEDYLNWDRSWQAKTDAFLHLAGSPGADKELQYAKSKGQRIFTSLEQIPPVGRIKGP